MRKSSGFRTKLIRKDLDWRQIGGLRTLEDKQPPFFVEWLSPNDTSTNEKEIAEIVKVEIAGDESRTEEYCCSELRTEIRSNAEVEYIADSASEGA